MRIAHWQRKAGEQGVQGVLGVLSFFAGVRNKKPFNFPEYRKKNKKQLELEIFCDTVQQKMRKSCHQKSIEREVKNEKKRNFIRFVLRIVPVDILFREQRSEKFCGNNKVY